MISLIGDVFNTIINTCFREVPNNVKVFIILGLLLVCFVFFSKSFNMGKSAQERPINWGTLLLAVLSLGLAVLYAVL